MGETVKGRKHRKMATKITIEEIWERIPEDGKGYISWAQIASQYQVAHNTIAKKVPQIKPFLIEKYIMGGGKYYSRIPGVQYADVVNHNEH